MPAGLDHSGTGQPTTLRISGSVWRPYLWAIAGAFALMIFAALNSYALFFTDSRSYVRGGGMAAQMVVGGDLIREWKANAPPPPATPPAAAPLTLLAPKPSPAAAAPAPAIQNNGITANRSVYYGILAFLGYALSDFWLTIFVQGYCMAALVAIVFLRVFEVRSLWAYVATLAALSVLTPAGAFVAFIMPDIFAATLVVGAALLLACWQRLHTADRVFTGAVVAYSVLAHTSHAIVLAGILALALVLGWLVRPLRSATPAFAVLAGCILVGFAGQMAFSMALTRATGAKPLLLPHVTAHLVDMGPGYAYLKDECPGAGFAVCQYLPVLPLYWEDFLGNPDPRHGVFAPADLETKRRISEEQIPFALAVLRHDPLGMTAGLTRDVFRQLVRFSLDSNEVRPAGLEFYQSQFPPDVVRQIKGSLVSRSDAVLRIVSATSLALVLVSLLVLGRELGAANGMLASGERRLFTVMVTAGILANGIVCAVLASPYDRFQARVIWLLPAIAIICCVKKYYRAEAKVSPA